MVGEGENVKFYFLKLGFCLLCSYGFFQCWAFLDFYEEPLILFDFILKLNSFGFGFSSTHKMERKVYF
jgi:hypothetical protein